MLRTLYHVTTDERAGRILAEGFLDAPHNGHVGVWLNDEPRRGGDPVTDPPAGWTILAVVLPADRAARYSVTVGTPCRDWCVPTLVIAMEGAVKRVAGRAFPTPVPPLLSLPPRVRWSQPLAYKQIDAARACGVSVRKFRQWKSKGLVRPAPVDGVELYPAAELLRLVDPG